MTQRRMWLAVAALALGGCLSSGLCDGDTVVDTTYAPMASFGPQISACINRRDCDPLCMAAFQLDGGIESCALTSVVRQDGAAQAVPVGTAIDLRLFSGVNVRVTYVEQVACDDDSDDWWTDWWDDDSDDDDADDGWDDDWDDDDSCDDSSCDDGSDDGSDDDSDDGSDDGDWMDESAGDLSGRALVSVAGRATSTRVAAHGTAPRLPLATPLAR